MVSKNDNGCMFSGPRPDSMYIKPCDPPRQMRKFHLGSALYEDENGIIRGRGKDNQPLIQDLCCTEEHAILTDYQSITENRQ